MERAGSLGDADGVVSARALLVLLDGGRKELSPRGVAGGGGGGRLPDVGHGRAERTESVVAANLSSHTQQKHRPVRGLLQLTCSHR